MTSSSGGAGILVAEGGGLHMDTDEIDIAGLDAADYVVMIEPIREIADETGYRPVDVGYALFAHDDPRA